MLKGRKGRRKGISQSSACVNTKGAEAGVACCLCDCLSLLARTRKAILERANARKDWG